MNPIIGDGKKLPDDMWHDFATPDAIVQDCREFIRQTQDFKRCGAEAVARLCVLLGVAETSLKEQRRLRSWLESAPTFLTAGRYKHMGAACLAYDALHSGKFATDPVDPCSPS